MAAWLWRTTYGRATSTSVKVAGQEVLQGALLADGGFAYVYKGRHAQTGQELAIRRALLQEEGARAEAEIELELLRSLPSHPNIVRFLGGAILQGAHNEESVTLFELCPGGNLHKHLDAIVTAARAKGLPALAPCCPCMAERDALRVLGGTAAALAVLHSMGVTHFDVKSENLLLGADGHWKLCDFGSASRRTFDFTDAPRQLTQEVQDFVHGRCTSIYRAPELADVHLKWPIGPKADIFALGCVAFATLTGMHPFPLDSALANISVRYSLPQEVESAYSPALLGWLRGTLAREPHDRPAASEIASEVEPLLAAKEAASPSPGAARAEEGPVAASRARVVDGSPSKADDGAAGAAAGAAKAAAHRVVAQQPAPATRVSSRWSFRMAVLALLAGAAVLFRSNLADGPLAVSQPQIELPSAAGPPPAGAP